MGKKVRNMFVVKYKEEFVDISLSLIHSRSGDRYYLFVGVSILIT